MEFHQTALPEVILIKSKVNGDDRGFFIESYKQSVFVENGITDKFVQDNYSRSIRGVLRGLHYQLNPLAQGKLVRCILGQVFDVAVDIRCGSPNYGKWIGYELSADNNRMLYIPAGFAHGFLTMSDIAELMYKTTAEYAREYDRGIIYNDPTIGIIWPNVDCEIILSEKDQNQPLLKDAENNFVYLAKST